MAFETVIIALSWREGKYAVVDSISGPINEQALLCEGRFQDVSSNPGYVDQMAVFAKDQFRRYLLWPNDERTAEVRQWYDALPEEVAFILVHRAEWESGLPD
ncbi:MAG: hypothetical protein D6781_12530 [Verrucomicrobia bacterium]|nr:MAG: hypothetical protein D6781_12530 [Verrucomicrobiota bacterium]